MPVVLHQGLVHCFSAATAEIFTMAEEMISR
jgi:hypothetical protein